MNEQATLVFPEIRDVWNVPMEKQTITIKLQNVVKKTDKDLLFK